MDGGSTSSPWHERWTPTLGQLGRRRKKGKAGWASARSSGRIGKKEKSIRKLIL
jgi:hypothetical protein